MTAADVLLFLEYWVKKFNALNWKKDWTETVNKSTRW